MPDRIYPTVQRVEPLASKPVRDRLWSDVELQHLTPGDDSMLAVGKRSYGRIRPTLPGFVSYCGINPVRVGHAPILWTGVLRVGALVLQARNSPAHYWPSAAAPSTNARQRSCSAVRQPSSRLGSTRLSTGSSSAA